MSEWMPATEAETAMRDALRAGDQELYFRILARTELLLPVSVDALAGRAPMGWGTWTTNGRTHVLAFTSTEALRACLAEHAGSAKRMPYHKLAGSWPNLEWWLAVNPGLPIEGYLPAWFVSQLARGDVRLPGRSLGSRARLDRPEPSGRARATAAVPRRTVPAQARPEAPAPPTAPSAPAPASSMPGPASSPPARASSAPASSPPARASSAPAPASSPPAPSAPAPFESRPPTPAPSSSPPAPSAPVPSESRPPAPAPSIPAPSLPPSAPQPLPVSPPTVPASTRLPSRRATPPARQESPAPGPASRLVAESTVPELPVAESRVAESRSSTSTVREPMSPAPASTRPDGHEPRPARYEPRPGGYEPGGYEPRTGGYEPPLAPTNGGGPGTDPTSSAPFVSGPPPAMARNNGVSAGQPEAPPFSPANAVEESLLAAAGDGSTDSFLSTLLLARVLVPLPVGGSRHLRPGDRDFSWHTETIDGESYVVVFTSQARLAEHMAASVGPEASLDAVPVKFVHLIRAWPDESWSFAVNPGTPVGATLPGAQIVALATWAAEVGLGNDADDADAGEEHVEPAPASPVPSPVPEPKRPTMMQKSVAPTQVGYYLDRGYDRVSGFVHRVDEVAHLLTPAKLHAALGLGYANSPFAPDAAEVYVLRWPAYRPSLYRIPYGGQTEAAMRAMEGWVIERPPFRGNGFAPGDSSDVIAEFKVDSVRLPHGAQLWRMTSDSAEELVALLDADGPIWKRVGES
jgi:hypothetical protein